jgi:ribosomal protein S18 acetylase RimI-like enzyme
VAYVDKQPNATVTLRHDPPESSIAYTTQTDAQGGGQTQGEVSNIAFRPLRAQDQAQLWDWLRIALWDPPPAGLRPREILDHPQVRIYAERWGRPSDVGVVAQVDGRDVGACWLRLLPEGLGLASIDATTPQLGIALLPAYQHRGFGEPLLRAALRAARKAGYTQVSLTVHPQNPAIALYERCGFLKREIRNTFHLMVAPLERVQ